MPTDTDAEVLGRLTTEPLTPVGRLIESSNGALLCAVGADDSDLRAIVKALETEQPLWDYPDGTLVERERAAYLISAAGGFDVVPPTVLRDGPLGWGSVQLWIGDLKGRPASPVRVLSPDEVPTGWLIVLAGRTPDGAEVVVAHDDDPALQTVAVLDAVLNNSDRKGGHLMRDGDVVRGCDHGVSLGAEPKLRTVLWGWAGEPIPEADLARLTRLSEALSDDLGAELVDLLTTAEVEALRSRVDALRSRGRFPQPTGDWPAIPWPAM